MKRAVAGGEVDPDASEMRQLPKVATFGLTLIKI